MASSQTSSPLQLQRPAFSPLDQIALNAGQDRNSASMYAIGAPSKSVIYERAVSLARNATITRRPGQKEAPAASGSDANSSQRLSQQQEQIQAMRAARLQRQQGQSHEQAGHDYLGAALRSPVHTALSAPSSPTIKAESLAEQQGSVSADSTFGLGNAFRDSVSSDLSFSSLSGTQERASMMGFGAMGGETTTLDQIADEVRGLALRRRQSVDTVRSSEFGEGGRWAQAWGSSDAGDDDRSYLGADDDDEDDEDEERRYALQAHAMSAFDIENANGPALGSLHRFERSARTARTGFQSGDLPAIQQAPNAEHFVTLTPSMRTTRPVHGSALSPNDPRSTKRDTITSIAADISGDESAEYLQTSADRGHERTQSESTASEYSSANSHVRVWPPTPAGSEVGGSEGRPTLNFARPTRSMNTAPTVHVNHGTRSASDTQSVFAQQQQQASRPSPRQLVKPMSPSAALAEPLGQPILDSFPTMRHTPGSNASPEASTSTYADVNLPMYPAGLDSLGEKRRKAIADHDGRESLVSDLDVETLRLDGSSNSSGSSQDWDSRRASTSTVGTVSSMTLEEQRRRRSQLERIQETDSDRRQSIMTIRGNDEGRRSPMTNNTSQDSPRLGAPSQTGEGIRRRGTIHSPDYEHADPMQTHQPRRSNTQPLGPPSPLFSSPKATQSPRFAPLNAPNSVPSFMNQRNGASTPVDNRSPSLAASTFSPSSHLSSGASMTGTFTSPPSTRRTARTASAATQSKAEHFLTLGIQHHESGDLSRSAYYFERSAKIDGGCVVGMCMWGMALREGWGVRKDQKRGFDWISRAAARAGELMNSSSAQQQQRTEAELKAIRSELKLSVYELGKCFCYGWGAKMDKQMALEYFELAAKLGDADAQAEAGALLAAGKGCKKDLKRAAMYYRMAEAQGYDTVGLSWIHKDKYDPVAVRAK